MILLLGQHVRLIPDATVFFQLAIFLVTVAVLTIFVFKPALKILDRRREQTDELQSLAQKLNGASDSMDAEYDRRMAEAKLEGSSLERELIKQGEEEGRAIVATAKQQEHAAMMTIRENLHVEAESARKSLSHETSEFVRLILNKVLGQNQE